MNPFAKTSQSTPRENSNSFIHKDYGKTIDLNFTEKFYGRVINERERIMNPFAKTSQLTPRENSNSFIHKENEISNIAMKKTSSDTIQMENVIFFINLNRRGHQEYRKR